MTKLAVKATVKHKRVNGKRKPFIITNQNIPGFKRDNERGFYYAPLNTKYRGQFIETTGKTISYLTGYEWPSPPNIKPYDHQKVTTEFMLDNHRAWILNKMRSGKTLSTIWALDRLFKMGDIKKALVAAPLSIMRGVWQRELGMVMPDMGVYIADDGVEDMYNAMMYTSVPIIVCNHDKLRHVYETIDKWNPNIIVVDEAGGFRAVKSDRVEALSSLLIDKHGTTHRARRRFLPLTATPCPQSPMDIYRLGKMISPDKLPRTMTEYRNKVMVTIGSGKQKMYKPRKNCEAYIQSCIYPAIKYNTEDCLDIPDQGYVTRHVNYTPAQTRALKQMARTHSSLITDIIKGTVTTVTAANAAVALSKYLQICGGVVLDSNGEPQISGASSRVAEIIAVFNEVGPQEKVIIMCPFTNIQHYLCAALKKKGIASLVMNGKLSGRERSAVTDQFRDDPEIKGLVLHPAVGKWGLNLTVANTTIWYVPVYSADEFIQGNARMQGPRSTSKQKTTVVRLSGGDKEDMLYERINTRADRQEKVTDVFRRVVT